MCCALPEKASGRRRVVIYCWRCRPSPYPIEGETVQPLKMQPVFKEKVWGGRHLRDLVGKNVPPDQKTGESWELADHPHGTSRVAEGPLAGKSLREVLKKHGQAILGRKLAATGWAERFGLLTSLCKMVALSVNRRYQGVYTLLQPTDESFLRTCRQMPGDTWESLGAFRDQNAKPPRELDLLALH